MITRGLSKGTLLTRGLGTGIGGVIATFVVTKAIFIMETEVTSAIHKMVIIVTINNQLYNIR